MHGTHPWPSSVTGSRGLWLWLIPLAGGLWAAWHLRRSYFFYDEWSMVDRVVHAPALDGTMASFNGHLWMLQYWVYRAQVFGFGVDDHRFVAGVFIASLIALHLSLGALFRAAGLSKAAALVLGGLLTYLGVASQNFLFAIQISTTLAMAAGTLACAVVLSRRPSPASAATSAVLLLASVAIDSGTALTTLTLGTCVIWLSWRGPFRLSMLPGLLALAAWTAFGDRGPVFAADLQAQASFGIRLLLLSAGGLLGQVGRIGLGTGAALLAASIGLIAFGTRRRALDRRTRSMLFAGSAAAVVVIVALAHARAGLPGFTFFDFNRYLQNVAIPLALAGAPALGAVARAWMSRAAIARRRRLVVFGGSAMALAAFVLGLPPLGAYASTFERYNVAARDGVVAATVVIREGCPSGAAPDESSRPLGALSPQVSTRLLRELVRQGRLQATSRARPDPDTVARMCGDAPR